MTQTTYHIQNTWKR